MTKDKAIITKDKEITTKEANYKIAKESNDNIDRLQQIASISFLYLGAELKKQKDKNLYKYLGDSPEYESFEAYLKSKDIELRKAYYLMQIHTTFIEKLKFEPEDLAGINWTSLRTLLPVIKKENAQDLIDKAKILTRGHLEIEMRQLKYGLHSLKDIESCGHEWERIIFYQCTKCGERVKLKPEDGKIIK